MASPKPATPGYIPPHLRIKTQINSVPHPNGVSHHSNGNQVNKTVNEAADVNDSFSSLNLNDPEQNALVTDHEFKDDAKAVGLESKIEKILAGLQGITPYLETLVKTVDKRDSKSVADFTVHAKSLITAAKLAPAVNTVRFDDDDSMILEMISQSEPESLQSDSKIKEGNEWRPYALTQIPRFEGKSSIPAGIINVRFSKEHIHYILGNEEWSPGVFFDGESETDREVLPGGTYYLIDSNLDPYFPQEPGSHGAKLVAFFPDTLEDGGGKVPQPSYNDAPLFITVNPDQYIYMGHYSQTRWSDHLDHDTQSRNVPAHVKEHWATELSRADRPEWVTQAIMNHFWPVEGYGGMSFSMQKDGHTENGITVTDDDVSKFRGWLEAYAEHLKEARLKATLLKKDNILLAFENACSAEEPGLRLQWEYLECVGFNSKFLREISKTRDFLLSPEGRKLISSSH